MKSGDGGCTEILSMIVYNLGLQVRSLEAKRHLGWNTSRSVLVSIGFGLPAKLSVHFDIGALAK